MGNGVTRVTTRELEELRRKAEAHDVYRTAMREVAAQTRQQDATTAYGTGWMDCLKLLTRAIVSEEQAQATQPVQQGADLPF